MKLKDRQYIIGTAIQEQITTLIKIKIKTERDKIIPPLRMRWDESDIILLVSNTIVNIVRKERLNETYK